MLFEIIVLRLRLLNNPTRTDATLSEASRKWKGLLQALRIVTSLIQMYKQQSGIHMKTNVSIFHMLNDIIRLKINSLAMNPVSIICLDRKRMSQLMRLWYLSHRRSAQAQARLRTRSVSPEPSLFAHIKFGSRRTRV